MALTEDHTPISVLMSCELFKTTEKSSYVDSQIPSYSKLLRPQPILTAINLELSEAKKPSSRFDTHDRSLVIKAQYAKNRSTISNIFLSVDK